MTSDLPILRALVRTILEHSEVHPWKLQGTGVMGLWLDPGRERRLHVWDPELAANDELIHDHPLDFTSTVIAGELTNTRYEQDPEGEAFIRERYTPGDEARRTTDSIRLSGQSTTYGPGDRYDQPARELHSSAQLPGTVTVLHFRPVDVTELTTCRRPGTPWVSGAARSAPPEEVRRIAALALARLE